MPGSLLLAPGAPVLCALLTALDEGTTGIGRRPLLVTTLDLVVTSVLLAARLLLCHYFLTRFLLFIILPQPPAFLAFLALAAAALPLAV